ncbi:hypothetical protein ScPMuIL_003986 [Solemya velum]
MFGRSSGKLIAAETRVQGNDYSGKNHMWPDEMDLRCLQTMSPRIHRGILVVDGGLLSIYSVINVYI